MEYIPARHAARVGLRCPARVTNHGDTGVAFELNLTRVAPGRSPFFGAGLRFDRTVSPDDARALRPDDWADVVMIDVTDADPYDWVQVSLPAPQEWLTWNNETVRQLARHIRESREFALLPVLADALEDAGCADESMLEHCRQFPADETRSWALELLATQT